MNVKCINKLFAHWIISYIKNIMMAVNGCGQCPQFVHSRMIFIIKII